MNLQDLGILAALAEDVPRSVEKLQKVLAQLILFVLRSPPLSTHERSLWRIVVRPGHGELSFIVTDQTY
jgi:hypothetical protein